MTVHELLDRTQTELATLAVTGLANAGAAGGELPALAAELAVARLGRLGERLQAIGQAGDEHGRTAAWAAAWAGAGLVRSRLLKPQVLDPGDVLALPQAPNVVFPRPEGDVDGLEGLLALLQGPEAMARAYAAGRLPEFGDEAVPGLLAVQKRCGRCIRFLAIDVLARIGSDEALAGLVGLLGDNDVARPLEAALLGLGTRAVAPVAEALAQARDKEKGRRRAAAKLLWRLGAVEDLRSSLDDGDELVQACAQAALWSRNRLAGQEARRNSAADMPGAVVLFEYDLMTVDVLVERLDGLYKNRLADAAAVLWHTAAEPPVLAHYLAQMREGRRSKDRERAAALVTHLANPEALEALLGWVGTGEQAVIDGLAELADSTAVWSLVDLAERQNPYQRDPAVRALGAIGDPAATSFLVQMLHQAPARARRDVVEKALVAIGVPAAGLVGEALQHLDVSQLEMAPALERILLKLRVPEAREALDAYRSTTDDLPRLLAHLADGGGTRQIVDQVVAQGEDALEPLLTMLATGHYEGQQGVIGALAQLAPGLSDEQRGRIISVLREQLRAQHKPLLPSGFGWTSNPLVAPLIAALCTLDASVAVPEIRAALGFSGVGEVLLKAWQRTQRPWLVDVITQGIQAPDTRYQGLHIAAGLAPHRDAVQRLWPSVEAVMQSETDVHVLAGAVACLRAWADPGALPLLRGLKNRWASVSGPSWWKNRLSKELDEALAELSKKRSLKDRLLGR